MPRKRVSFEDRVRANIARYEERKTSALSEIERCEKGIEESRIALRIFRELSGNPPKSRSQRPGGPLPEPTGEMKGKESMASLIKRIASAQTARFTPGDISEVIRRDYPLVFSKLPRNYVATTLWKIAQRKPGPIVLVKQGGSGTPGEYETSRPPHATAA
jgi:hypothetical protein